MTEKAPEKKVAVKRAGSFFFFFFFFLWTFKRDVVSRMVVVKVVREERSYACSMKSIRFLGWPQFLAAVVMGSFILSRDEFLEREVASGKPSKKARCCSLIYLENINLTSVNHSWCSGKFYSWIYRTVLFDLIELFDWEIGFSCRFIHLSFIGLSNFFRGRIRCIERENIFRII